MAQNSEDEMHILGLIAENYKRLRVVEISPKGRVIQITGKNGQGKTSVLDAIWSALVGSKAIPEKPVRKGADKARIRLNLGDFNVIRTINPNGAHSLTVENAKGTKVSSPQSILDELLGELTFDPLLFISRQGNETVPQLRKRQIETLRKVAKVELDTEALDKSDQEDYTARTDINREIKRLEVEANSIIVQDGLPKEKLNEAEALEQLNNASAANQQAQATFKAKQHLKECAAAAHRGLAQANIALEQRRREIEELERRLQAEKKALADGEAEAQTLQQNADQAQKTYDDAPEGTPVDVSALTQQLQHVQLVNREIDKRSRHEALEKQLREKRQEADKLTRAIEDRVEQRKTAIQTATMPIPGLSFDDSQVIYNGIPLDQLGEGEQIRISTSIAMAANPKLRILRILHGEAMDEDSLKILAEMAEEHDFQVWMARVDSSGKVGIVMEDGMVKAEE